MMQKFDLYSYGASLIVYGFSSNAIKPDQRKIMKDLGTKVIQSIEYKGTIGGHVALPSSQSRGLTLPPRQIPVPMLSSRTVPPIHRQTTVVSANIRATEPSRSASANYERGVVLEPRLNTRLIKQEYDLNSDDNNSLYELLNQKIYLNPADNMEDVTEITQEMQDHYQKLFN